MDPNSNNPQNPNPWLSAQPTTTPDPAQPVASTDGTPAASTTPVSPTPTWSPTPATPIGEQPQVAAVNFAPPIPQTPAEPIPTFTTPATPAPADPSTANPLGSPFSPSQPDNPLGGSNPAQSASLDLGPMANAQPAPGPQDNAPTDLTQLMGTSSTAATPNLEPADPQSTPADNPNPAPETQTVDSSQPQATAGSQVVTAPAHGFPKFLLLGGIILILLVAVGSGYFILGIGKAPQETTSVPAEESLTNPPKAAAPTVIPTTAPTPTVSAGGPQSFGALQGATPSASVATNSAQPSSGKSAIDLLKQRQGQ